MTKEGLKSNHPLFQLRSIMAWIGLLAKHIWQEEKAPKVRGHSAQENLVLT